MATSTLTGPGHLCVTDNQKRWLVAGIALNKILIPQIRPFVEQDVNTEYNNLKASHNIHAQSTSGRLQKWPARRFLKYENINGNDVHPKLPGKRFNYSLFDCRVASHVDFARLYVENYMAKFTAFDDQCDASAVLLLLGGVPAFNMAVQTAADVVRTVRNDWAHCVFSKWDQHKFLTSFSEMEQLVRSMALPTADETKLLGELKDWESKGVHLCMNSPVDPALLQLVQQELKSLHDGLDNMSVESVEEKTKVQHELGSISAALEEVKQRLQRLETRQKNLELTQSRFNDFQGHVYKKIEVLENNQQGTNSRTALEDRVNVVEDSVHRLQEQMDSLAKSKEPDVTMSCQGSPKTAGTTASGNDIQAEGTTAGGNDTQAEGTTAGGNDIQAEGTTAGGNDIQAEGTTAGGNDTQAEGTTAGGNDTQAEAFSEERLNYLRVCHMVTEVLPKGLRLIFKQEWDKRYKTTLGEWQDTQKNGLDFFNSESKANQKRNARYLAIINRGDSAEWDCTTLFYAILYSSSICTLDPLIRSSVDDLREFRNSYFAHTAGARLSDWLFKAAVRKVESAFQALGLSIAKIQTTKTSSFTDLASLAVLKTKELESLEVRLSRLKEEVHGVKEQLESQERQLQYGRQEQSFCDLPPVPPHQIAGRESDVATIVNELDNLRDTNKNKLSYFYISGNPGSGKSQLAGLVAKRVYDKTTDLFSSPSFVKSLNAENTETLLDSYVLLATQVSCPELTVTSIYTSKEKAIEEKIYNLKDLIGTKISFYERWLLVVDNVTSLSSTLGFLPELGSEQWGNGQLLITTQDCSCISPDSSLLCRHTSISQGMMASEASGILATISGIKDDTTGANSVAKALDYQPLALASAAFYVAKVRELRPYFGWNDYLKKLKEGKLALTQNILAKANPIYPKTMTAAIQIAVTRELNCDEEMKHVLTFLAFCAPQPLRLDIVTNYVLSVGRVQDKEDIGLRIQGSSLILIDKREDGVCIRLHQVVHDIIKLTLINDSMNSNEDVRIVRAAVISFNQFIEETIPWAWDKLDSVAETKHFVGHLKTLAMEFGPKFVAEEFKKDQSITDISLSLFLRRLGRITQCNAEYHSARAFYGAAVKVMNDTQTREGSRELARGCTGLGRVVSSLGFHQKGKEHLERALSIYHDQLDLDDVEAARIYSFLGKVERRLGNLRQAKEHFNTSLLILSKLNLEQDDDAAHTYLHLGSVQCVMRDYPEAERNLQLALSIYLEKFAPGHVNVGRTFHHLGLLQCENAKFPKAKEYLERALSILLEKLGTEHVEVARGYDLFGVVELKMGENQQAREHFELALSIFLKKLGPDHEDVERTTRSLSLCNNSP